MHLRSNAYWLQKDGNPPEDYEDAAWPPHAVESAVRGFRCAVADGATEASFSSLWARMLVRAWCKGELSGRKLHRSLPRLQQAWRSRAGAAPLPWYAEEKLRSGAFSALLGLTLEGERTARLAYPEPPGLLRCDKRWEAIAIGDACLFQVRDNRLLCAFPLAHSDQFTSRPYLLSTQPGQLHVLEGAFACASGFWESGDLFLLMTDALACWFLAAAERGERPWRIVRAVLAKPDRVSRFAEWIAELRHKGRVRNDDVTLLLLELG